MSRCLPYSIINHYSCVLPCFPHSRYKFSYTIVTKFFWVFLYGSFLLFLIPIPFLLASCYPSVACVRPISISFCLTFRLIIWCILQFPCLLLLQVYQAKVLIVNSLLVVNCTLCISQVYQRLTTKLFLNECYESNGRHYIISWVF